MTEPSRTQSNASRYLFVLIAGLLVGIVATVMAMRAIQARQDPFPNSLMNVMARQSQLLGDSRKQTRCSINDSTPRLQTLRLLSNDMDLAFPGLRGTAQLANASAALTALEYLKDRLPVSMGAIRAGLIETELPGRFQVLPGQPAVVLDVAHNPQSAQVLADNLGNMGFYNRTHAVVGMLGDKDIATTLAALKGKVDTWLLADLAVPRGASAVQLAEAVAGLGGEVHCHDSPYAAWQAALKQAAENDRILVFGSFHTVAGVLPHVGQRHRQPGQTPS